MARGFLIVALAGLASIPAGGQTSYPFLYHLYPCGVRQGATVEIALNGEHNFNGAYRVLIEGAGVTAEVVVPEKGWPPPDAKTKVLPAVNEIKLKVTAAPDAPLGVRELRVVTPRGVSSVGQLVIGDSSEVMEKEPNNDQKEAQEIAPPVTVNGRIQQGEDVDTFKFKAGTGEELTFSVLCMRIEDKIHDLQEHADPMLTLRDSTGRELAANDDYYRGDPLLHYKFDKAGDYYIQVRDVRYLGNPHWTYRLTVTNRPYVTSFLPMGVRPGTKAESQLAGFNLGAAKTASLDVPSGQPMGDWCTQLKTASGPTNPVPVYVTDLPVTTISAPPPSGAPTQISVPAAINARIGAPLEHHRYKFRATKGANYVFEIEARRFDSMLDSVLSILNDKGQQLVLNDDSARNPDSRIDWTAPDTGDYLVEVRDLLNHGGENFPYLLTARQSSQDFTLRCDDDKMRLGPGNSSAWYIQVQRRFGFNGEVKVEVKGLPTGVTAAPLTIPGNMTQGCLILTAAPDAKVGVGQVDVIGTATVNGSDGKPMTVTHRAVPISEIYSPGGGRAQFPVNTQAVCVADDYDIILELSTTNVTLAPGGTARIDVNVKRNPKYTKPVTLDLLLRHLGSVYGNPFPPGVSLDEGASKTLLGDNETKGHIVIKADANAQPVTNLPIAVLGSVSINFVVKVSYAGPPVLLTVTAKK